MASEGGPTSVNLCTCVAKPHLEHQIGALAECGFVGRVYGSLLRELCVELGYVVFPSLKRYKVKALSTELDMTLHIVWQR